MKNPGVTWRSVLIGALLIPPNAYWVIQLELVWRSSYPTIITLIPNVVFSLFVVIALNILIRRFYRNAALSYGELLTIYIMMAVSTSLCGVDVVQTLVHIVPSAFWFATPENEWAEMFHSHLPEYFTLSDKTVLREFFGGGSSFWKPEYVKAWLPPIIVWMAFILILLFTMLCINTILRKQWVEREHLAYPVVRLPQEMARGGGGIGIWRSKAMWIGFTIAAAINLINGLSFLYPAIPDIPVKFRSVFQFTEKPWNAAGWVPVSFYPFVLGIGFLMPLDLSFSCWFFYLVWKAERVIGSATGINLQGYPFSFEQAAGVWIGIFMFTMWISRHHLKRVLAAGFGNRSQSGDEKKEPMPYRTALLGIAIGTVLLAAFCNQMGMAVWMSFAYFLIYFALGATITRIRAELGPPVHDLYGAGPDYIITRIAGTRRIGESSLTAMTLLYWLNRESYGSFPMAHQMEGMKLAEGGNIHPRRLILAIMVAVFIGGVSCFWVVLQFGYRLGSEVRFAGPAPWFAIEGFRRLASWLAYPQRTDFMGLGFMTAGLFFSLALLVMRMRFFWWPLHPIGYAISYAWVMNLLWFPIFLSFIAKTIILRYRGLNSYRRAVPFFLGLILGEYLMGGIWNILGISLGMRMYAFWM
jgi:hypothetical protein